ncbi:MAG TPA: DUF2460 domain-containing protein [Alphaproteobacteria bacterium]|nr:DUF2460 domain-containing protein [Alphaproteobacteria bacterium]
MSTAVFPALAGLEYPVTRTPVFKTLVQESVSGKENRAALQVYPRWKWSLSFNFLRDDSNNEFRTLLGFFLARQGAYDSFLFDDVDDDGVTDQPVGVGDGSNLNFPLVRTLGGFVEPILAVNTNVVATVKVNGVLQAFTSQWGWLFGAYGPYGIAFTPGNAPGNGASVTATFNYYWPVRFTADDNDFTKFMNKLWEQKKLEFESVKN